MHGSRVIRLRGGEAAANSTRVPNAFPQDQRVDPNLVSLRVLTYPGSGAGDGNQTHTGGASGAWKQVLWRDGESQCDGRV